MVSGGNHTNVVDDYGTSLGTESAQFISDRGGESLTIKESIPYFVSKEGPNAHLFKFQTIKRVNHEE